jgi:hypothetical protein
MLNVRPSFQTKSLIAERSSLPPIRFGKDTLTLDKPQVREKRLKRFLERLRNWLKETLTTSGGVMLSAVAIVSSLSLVVGLGVLSQRNEKKVEEQPAQPDFAQSQPALNLGLKQAEALVATQDKSDSAQSVSDPDLEQATEVPVTQVVKPSPRKLKKEKPFLSDPALIEGLSKHKIDLWDGERLFEIDTKPHIFRRVNPYTNRASAVEIAMEEGGYSVRSADSQGSAYAWERESKQWIRLEESRKKPLQPDTALLVGGEILVFKFDPASQKACLNRPGFAQSKNFFELGEQVIILGPILPGFSLPSGNMILDPSEDAYLADLIQKISTEEFKSLDVLEKISFIQKIQNEPDAVRTKVLLDLAGFKTELVKGGFQERKNNHGKPNVHYWNIVTLKRSARKQGARILIDPQNAVAYDLYSKNPKVEQYVTLYERNSRPCYPIPQKSLLRWRSDREAIILSQATVNR